MTYDLIYFSYIQKSKLIFERLEDLFNNLNILFNPVSTITYE